MTAPVAAAPARPARPARTRRPGRHLKPVERPKVRRSPAVPVLVGAGIVITALFALAAFHALLITGQIRLDDLRNEVASETEEIRRLRLRVAELESPDRVLDVARDRLGMVAPDEVGYLLPVGVAGGPDEPVRVDAAVTPPPPPPPAPVDARSPEEREVEASVAEDGATGVDTDPGDPTDPTDPTADTSRAEAQVPSEGGPSVVPEPGGGE